MSQSLGPSREELLEASQRRLATVALSPDEEDELRFQQERDMRQAFRRLLDPGILRGVDHKTALASIKTLLTIAENLLNHPENDKYHQFKASNTIVKKHLVEVKGALEYAVAMGFCAEVKDLQPIYIWNSRKTREVRIGASILKEALDHEAEKEERIARAKQAQKSLSEQMAKQVKLAFEDDRKRKALHDKLEKERRLAREEIALRARQAEAELGDISSPMPGGQRLSEDSLNVEMERADISDDDEGSNNDNL